VKRLVVPVFIALLSFSASGWWGWSPSAPITIVSTSTPAIVNVGVGVDNPISLPGSYATGDMLLVVVASYGTCDTFTAGWTNVSSTSYYVKFFYKFAASNSEATPAVNGSTGGCYGLGGSVAFRNVSSVTPIVTYGIGALAVSGNTFSSPSVTVTNVNQMVLIGAGSVLNIGTTPPVWGATPITGPATNFILNGNGVITYPRFLGLWNGTPGVGATAASTITTVALPVIYGANAITVLLNGI
jgi:hypothetical protein